MTEDRHLDRLEIPSLGLGLGINLSIGVRGGGEAPGRPSEILNLSETRETGAAFWYGVM